MQMTKEQARYEKMTKTPIPKLICTLAVPTIISMLTTSFYNLVDTFFVGKLGTSATAAVGVIFSIMALIQAIGFTFGVGSGSFVSRLMGAKENEKANSVASTAFFASILTGFALMAFGLIFLDKLVYWLGATDTIAPFAMDYARIILFGAPIMTAVFVMNNLLRGEGAAMLSMIGVASGAVINTVLDPIFIFVLDMGISGAALATVLSQLASFLILYFYFRGGKSNLSLSIKKISTDMAVHKEILKIGSPSLFRQGLASLAGIFLNLACAPFGDAAIAAMSVVNRVTMFIQSVLLGFGQGFQPVAGFSWGSKNYKRLLEGYTFCLKTGFIVMTCIALCGFTFATPVVEIFRKGDPDVTSIGSLALRFACVMVPFQAYTIITNMLFQSIGRAKAAAVLALARQGLFFIPFILTLPNFLGILGIQIAQPLGDFGTFCISFPLSISIIKELKLLVAAEEKEKNQQ
ncbi:MAG: MATE family efflux transporter [Clostridia bacterium]|nr:MATE family efflux transporter [Clostridia bacterium]